MNLGERLKMYRQRAGYTQRSLSQATGINIRSIQNYEQGKNNLARASYDRVSRIAGVLGCSRDDLIPTNYEKTIDN